MRLRDDQGGDGVARRDADGFARRDSDGAARRDEDDVAGHSFRRDTDGVARRDSDGFARRDSDGATGADEDDVEGHRMLQVAGDDQGPEGLMRGGPSTQGEIFRRDQPHGD